MFGRLRKEMKEIKRVKLPVRFARQKTPFTCGAKALQVILNFHNPEQYNLRYELETEIFEFARLGKYDASTTPGLALFALEHGYPVEHIVKFKEIFQYPEEPISGYTMPKEEFEEKFAIDIVLFEKARQKGLKTIVVPNITESNILKKYLTKGIPLLAMLELGGILHDVVIRGFSQDFYMIIDPDQGETGLHARELIRHFDTRYGVSILAIYPRKTLSKNELLSS